MLSFVAQDQTNISADSLGVSINKPFREVLVQLLSISVSSIGFISIFVVDGCSGRSGCRKREGAAPGARRESRFQFQTTDLFDRAACIRFQQVINFLAGYRVIERHQSHISRVLVVNK
jgi:hypothetical protein